MFKDRTREVGKVATSVFTDDDGYTKVVYHSTVVVRWNELEILLNSNGWRTATTKTRMNQAAKQFRLDFDVYQQDFEWFVDIGNEVIPFVDGMSFPRQNLDRI